MYTDPWKTKYSLERWSSGRAKSVLENIASGKGITTLPEAIYALDYYTGVFYHVWAEVLPRLLFTLAHMPVETRHSIPILIGCAAGDAKKAHIQTILIESGLAIEEQFVTVQTDTIYHVEKMYASFEFMRRREDDVNTGILLADNNDKVYFF